MKLIDNISAHAEHIASIRRDIHAHPELCYEENRTAQVVMENLTRWGIPFVSGLGKTGVLGIIKGKTDSRGLAIGLRADMDALPMQEANEFAHKSQHAGKMHACGHDGHTAMLLGAAHYLVQHNDFDGTVYLVFQPAEEGGGGAKAMMDDGLFKDYPMQHIYGMHNWPGAPVGMFGATPGAMMASSNEFRITLTGRGAHAALPHNGADPLIGGAALVQALQSIITRNKKPIDSAVLSITQFHSGSATNVIPNTAELVGTVRTFSIEVLDLIEKRMREISQGIAQSYELTVSVDFNRNYPPLLNTPAEAAFCMDVASSIVGEQSVIRNSEATMGAEDFAFFLLEKPGCYVFIGNGEGEHRFVGHGPGPCMLHNPSYDFNDQILPLGATYWVKLVDAYFKR